MTLIALLIGLIIERLATQIFHWRRMRWLERIIDKGFSLAARFAGLPALISVIVLTVILVLPVAAVTIVLGDTLFGFPHVVLAVVVLFFSLGPNDIGEDVNEYCSALEEGDEERIEQTAKTLVENTLPDAPLERIRCVEEAVCIQANNRLFAVIFWFVLLGPLGPLGAWAYRVTDLVRRRAVFQAGRVESAQGSGRGAAWMAGLDTGKTHSDRLRSGGTLRRCPGGMAQQSRRAGRHHLREQRKTAGPGWHSSPCTGGW